MPPQKVTVESTEKRDELREFRQQLNMKKRKRHAEWAAVEVTDRFTDRNFLLTLVTSEAVFTLDGENAVALHDYWWDIMSLLPNISIASGICSISFVEGTLQLWPNGAVKCYMNKNTSPGSDITGLFVMQRLGTFLKSFKCGEQETRPFAKLNIMRFKVTHLTMKFTPVHARIDLYILSKLVGTCIALRHLVWTHEGTKYNTSATGNTTISRRVAITDPQEFLSHYETFKKYLKDYLLPLLMQSDMTQTRGRDF
eukprot:TRINITY_DN30623_c0_g1_i1.p1 TRINITY_DN30623_c0_g1~~TRINITY_DN30623_c0_g1_i1.p1  ORF type:complete len:254 (+),score=33.53 TRINITY_DN30623_c0_g1_i1:66-827(+)